MNRQTSHHNIIDFSATPPVLHQKINKTDSKDNDNYHSQTSYWDGKCVWLWSTFKSFLFLLCQQSVIEADVHPIFIPVAALDPNVVGH